jgi:hypothetical protein
MARNASNCLQMPSVWQAEDGSEKRDQSGKQAKGHEWRRGYTFCSFVV